MAHLIFTILQFLCFILCGVLFLRIRMGKAERFVKALNPVKADGRRVFILKKQRAALLSLAGGYTLSFGAVSMVSLICLIFPVLPVTILSALLYFHGGSVVIGAFCYMAYLDNHYQI